MNIWKFWDLRWAPLTETGQPFFFQEVFGLKFLHTHCVHGDFEGPAGVDAGSGLTDPMKFMLSVLASEVRFLSVNAFVTHDLTRDSAHEKMCFEQPQPRLNRARAKAHYRAA